MLKAFHKINNNAVICRDETGRELVAIGKGLGYERLPRVLSLDDVERTFYGIDPKYYQVLQDLPTDMLDFSARVLDIARNELPYELRAHVVLTLADHLAFARERVLKNIRVHMPLAYDVEQLYPTEYKIGQYIVRRFQKEFHIGLPPEEAVAVAMNLLNGRAADQPEPDGAEEAKLREEMLEDITAIVENHFRCIVNRSGFNYSRYATHLQYLFVRIRTGQAIQSENLAMYHTLREEYPDVAACVAKIADHIQQEWGCTLTEEEQLYLILHVNRICIKEGL